MILLSNFLVIPITPSIDDLKSFERFLKRYEDAIALTDFIHDHPYGLTQEEKRILLTSRAAAWTDIFKLSTIIKVSIFTFN